MCSQDTTNGTYTGLDWIDPVQWSETLEMFKETYGNGITETATDFASKKHLMLGKMLGNEGWCCYSIICKSDKMLKKIIFCSFRYMTNLEKESISPFLHGDLKHEEYSCECVTNFEWRTEILKIRHLYCSFKKSRI